MRLPPYVSVAELGEVRDGVLHRITELLRTDHRVEAAWLAGSFGRGEPDAWSDLDLHIAVADDHVEEFLAERPVLFGKVGEPVLVQDEMASNVQTGATYQLVWFAGGVHVDWNIGPASVAVKPAEHWLLFERRPFDVIELPALDDAVRRREARRWLIFFWAMAPIAVKYTARRTSRAAVKQIDLLSQALICMWRLTNEPDGPDPWQPSLTNRGLEDELDQRLPQLGATITPHGLCQVIEELCHEARRLEPKLRTLDATVDPRVADEAERLLALCRTSLDGAPPPRRKYR